MDIVEQEFVAAMSKAMYDCQDQRAEELYAQLRTYQTEKNGIAK